MHRKAVIRALKREQFRDPWQESDRRGRPIYYGPDVTVALKDVWEVASNLCGELVHPLILEYVSILKRDRMWHYSLETTQKLLAMSEGTVKLRVASLAVKARLIRGRSATAPSPLKDIIPIVMREWHDKPPGWGQVDTVVHSGASLVGDMVYTVNYTDIATLWDIPRAQWNKGERATQQSLSEIKEQLPTALIGIHPDSGGEFINWHVKGWCDEEDIKLTRSRPYHKNDNAYVEQKNGHVVRRFVGYQRLDCQEIVPLLNKYYDILTLYLNHFVTTRKCSEKVRIGSKYRRRYDKAQTPYQRMIAHSTVLPIAKTKLRKKHETLNPLLLKKQADKLLIKVFDYQKSYGNSSSSR